MCTLCKAIKWLIIDNAIWEVCVICITSAITDLQNWPWPLVLQSLDRKWTTQRGYTSEEWGENYLWPVKLNHFPWLCIETWNKYQEECSTLIDAITLHFASCVIPMQSASIFVHIETKIEWRTEVPLWWWVKLEEGPRELERHFCVAKVNKCSASLEGYYVKVILPSLHGFV